MEHNEASNSTQAWEYANRLAASGESEGIRDVRDDAQTLGFTPVAAVQAQWLALMAQMLQATSVLIVGTGSAVEVAHVLVAMDHVKQLADRGSMRIQHNATAHNSEGRSSVTAGQATSQSTRQSAGQTTGQLTVLDSSERGAVLIRSIPARLDNAIQTRLRVAHTDIETFVARLNPGDYDMVVIDGDVHNYAPMADYAYRLLRLGGALVCTDAFAQAGEDSLGGVMNPADHSAKAERMRELTRELLADERFNVRVVPVGTGFIVASKQYDTV